MRVRKVGARVMPQRGPEPAWPPFVLAALLFTVTLGAGTGAIDLWHLRVAHHPVPVDHHRAHGLGQLFGFLWLFTMGMSLHLAPRFFGANPAPRWVHRLLTWVGIPGVVLVVVGRLGSLVPGSAALGLVGAVAVLVAMGTWAGLVASFWLWTPGPRDALHRFVLAGVGWWLLAALWLAVWSLGPAFGGWWLTVPLEPVWALALYGGTGSWLWGIFLRAGMCVLRIERPGERAQRLIFATWQAGAALAAAAALVPSTATEVLGRLGLAVAATTLLGLVKPFAGRGLGEEGLLPRALQAGFGFLGVFAALCLWGAAAELGWVEAPALLRDAIRHAFSLGTVTLVVFSFAGRMVPGFGGVALRWSRAWDVGVTLVAGGALLRLVELAGTASVARALAGASGALAWLGVCCVGASLWGSLRQGAARRREVRAGPQLIVRAEG